AVSVLDGLAAGNANGIALDLDIEVRLADAGQLGDQDDIVTLAKDVERRVGAGGARARSEPSAGAERIECLLELKQGVEGIGKKRCHDSSSFGVIHERRIAPVDPPDASLALELP